MKASIALDATDAVICVVQGVAETTRTCTRCQGRRLHHLRTAKPQRNLRRDGKHETAFWVCNECGSIADPDRSFCPLECAHWRFKPHDREEARCPKHSGW